MPYVRTHSPPSKANSIVRKGMQYLRATDRMYSWKIDETIMTGMGASLRYSLLLMA